MDMVIDYTIARIANYSIISFLKDKVCNKMQFDLLYFLVRHPKAKLTLCSIAGALDTSRSSLRDVIMALVREGFLISTTDGNGLTTYALANPQINEYINELSNLDWLERKELEKQIEDQSGLLKLSGM